MKRDYKIFTTLWFLIGLLILLLNDFVFKEHFGNWTTGKLSDFAGLFIFPLFWTSLLPRHKNKIFWLTGMFFIFWKSPNSQYLLNFWNSLNLITLDRVVDYSDLLSLIVLPLAYYIESKKDNTFSLRFSPFLPILISTFAFISTSRSITPTVYYSETYQIKCSSRNSLIEDFNHSDLNVKYYKYNDTEFDDEHAEIHHLNDTIENLCFLIKSFNNKTNTVEIELAWIDYYTSIYNEHDGEALDEKYKSLLKEMFEKQVIDKFKNEP